ncbi:uncharacterized protein METZ01_LOCUS413480, partial [marine metagenome]
SKYTLTIAPTMIIRPMNVRDGITAS